MTSLNTSKAVRELRVKSGDCDDVKIQIQSLVEVPGAGRCSIYPLQHTPSAAAVDRVAYNTLHVTGNLRNGESTDGRNGTC